MPLEIKIKTGHLHYYSGSNITKCIYMYAIKIKQKKKTLVKHHNSQLKISFDTTSLGEPHSHISTQPYYV